MDGLLLRSCEIGGRAADVRVVGGRIAEIGMRLRRRDEPEVDAQAGALLPGLHDHHVHLLALAAALRSVPCGPPHVTDAVQLAAALRTAAARTPAARVVRGTGYHEQVAGQLDRWRLDALAGGAAVRVQHRSGVQWVLSSAALRSTGLEHEADPAVERDAGGRATGRLHRGDHLLRRGAVDPALPLAEVGALLAEAGVTGVTDATPALDDEAAALLEGPRLPQRVVLMGRPGTPRKVVLDEWRGLDLSALVQLVEAEHAGGTPVAVHCVTRAEVVVAVEALRLAGSVAGDRLEHASVLPRELDAVVRELGLTIVTQPWFVAARGDDYRRDVEERDHDLLWRCGSLAAAGIPVAAGTDAPHGDPDPWASMRAAVSRRTASGEVLGPVERVPPARALALFLGPPHDPGGLPRRVAVGVPADLVLLDVPLAEALEDLDRRHVRLTLVDGHAVHGT